MNVTLTESGYTLDGKWRLVPVEPTYEMAILSLDGGLDYKLGVKAAPPPPQQSQWQPIATAPIDTPVLVSKTPTMGICVAENNGDGKWYLEIPNGWEETEHPTHWMPLPEPAP